MEFDRTPSKPVVPSALAADREFRHWLGGNTRQELKDADGHVWECQIKAQELPDRESTHGGVVQLNVSLRTMLTASELLATGVLDSKEDRRLASLLGNHRVPMAYRTFEETFPDFDEARRWLVEQLPAAEEKLRRTSLRLEKRDLIGKYIDQQGQFGCKIP